MSDHALLLIDLQNDYFPGGAFALENMDAATANAVRLLEAARKRGDLVVHVRHEFTSSDAPFFRPGTKGAEISDRILPLPGETVIVKHYVNAFRETSLKAVLDEAGVRTLTIAGAMSQMCVEGATRAAADFGYGVTVVHDAVTTRDFSFNGVNVPAAEVHASAMAALAFAYATLKSTDEVLAGA